MRKATTKSFGRGGWLAVTSLALTLAFLGCTSNQYAGNGQPTMLTPTQNSVDHSSTYGSSSGNAGTPPMASSFTYVGSSRVDVDALANLAAEQGYRGRILGPADPGGYGAGVTIATGQFVSPALIANPQVTVNSSISSGPMPATGAVFGVDTGPLAAATGISGTAGSTAVTISTTPSGTTTVTPAVPTTAASMMTAAGTNAALTATTANAPLVATTGNPALTAAAIRVPTTAAATTSSRTTAPATLRTATATGTIAGGIRIETGSSGNILVTNVSSTAPATVKGGK